MPTTWPLAACPADLDQTLAAECKALLGDVEGPDDPLFDLQVAVARGVLAAGGIPADELTEWAAARRLAEGTRPRPTVTRPPNELRQSGLHPYKTPGRLAYRVYLELVSDCLTPF